MYARQNADSRPSRGLRIPSNYSGNAFSAEAQTPRESDEAQQVPEDINETQKEEPPREAASPSEEPTAAVGLSRLFGKGASGGIGFEELLILGLIFLISQNDTKDDLAFLLLLLLFIK